MDILDGHLRLSMNSNERSTGTTSASSGGNDDEGWPPPPYSIRLGVFIRNFKKFPCWGQEKLDFEKRPKTFSINC